MPPYLDTDYPNLNFDVSIFDFDVPCFESNQITMKLKNKKLNNKLVVMDKISEELTLFAHIFFGALLAEDVHLLSLLDRHWRCVHEK